jgi:hypothetical protein
VFLATAPAALVALLVVLALKEVPLRGPGGPARAGEAGPGPAGQPAVAGAAR